MPKSMTGRPVRDGLLVNTDILEAHASVSSPVGSCNAYPLVASAPRVQVQGPQLATDSFVQPQSYGTEIKNYVKATFDTSCDPSRSIISEYTVIKLEHVKERSSRSAHEDVIATVKHQDNHHTKRLSFGRFSGHNGGEGNKTTRSSFILSSDISSKSSKSASLVSNALDLVKIAEDGSSVPYVTYTPGTDSLPLLHLLLIVERVHDLAPIYSLLTRQCYWFALMVMAISMLEGGSVEAPHNAKGYPNGQTINRTPYGPSLDENFHAIEESRAKVPYPKEDLKVFFGLTQQTKVGKNKGVRIMGSINPNEIWIASKYAREWHREMQDCLAKDRKQREERIVKLYNGRNADLPEVEEQANNARSGNGV